MTPYYERGGITIFNADCREALKSLSDCSVDSVVTDPPAGIGFMGKEWDDFRRARNEADAGRENVFGRTSKTGPEYARCDRANFVEFLTGVMKECLRVLKPGGHAVVWSIPRTSHWTAWALEDAGFEVRDCVLHLFGSGFPKSLDVSKAIDKRGGHNIAWFGPWLRTERQRRGITQSELAKHFPSKSGGETGCVANWELSLNMPTPEQFNKLCEVLSLPFDLIEAAKREVVGQSSNGIAGGTGRHAGEDGAWGFNREFDITAPATDAAKQWQGWGTALKPAAEYWWLCRKPLEGTVAANVQGWGTGALNIDGCRVDADWDNDPNKRGLGYGFTKGGYEKDSGFTQGVKERTEYDTSKGRWPANVTHDGSPEVVSMFPEQSGGGAPARRFSDKTRNAFGDFKGTECAEGIGPSSGNAARFFYAAKASSSERGRSNDHPTVKPIDLMRWLCRLVTPPDGTVLDCFMGSGSTLVAAREEGFKSIGIEREEHYAEIAKGRLAQEVLF